MSTTEQLISSVKLRSFAPISQNAFSDDDIIFLLNEQMKADILPTIFSAREDYFLSFDRLSLVSGLDHYSIPKRAVGNALKDLWILDNSGNRIRTLPRTTVHDLPYYIAQARNASVFLLKGDEIVLFPVPSESGGFVEVWYFLRPNDLVLTTSTAKITAIGTDGLNTVFTVDTDLTSSISAGTMLDVIDHQSPFLLWNRDIACQTISSTQVAVLTSSIINEVGTVEAGVGDIISIATQSNVPMIPEEFHPILAQSVAVRLLEAIGDLNKLQLATATLERMKSAGIKMIQNRVESELQTIINRHSILDHSGYGLATRTVLK